MGKGKGDKYKNRNKNNVNRSIAFSEDPDTIYGQVQEAYGGARFKVICTDTIIRNCKVRGSMQKKIYIQIGDVVLVNFMEGGELDKGFIIERYYDHEVKELRKKKLIPDNFEATEDIPIQIEFDTSKI